MRWVLVVSQLRDERTVSRNASASGDGGVSLPVPLFVLGLLFLDLFVLHRNARKISFKKFLWLSGFWISIALAFGGFVWFVAGPTMAGGWAGRMNYATRRLR